MSNLHLAWARLFVHALHASGVEEVVICPGSRSTPLTLAAAAEADWRCHVAVDERSAAFFALGRARLTRQPSAIFCTSGTAGAHCLPAVIEASQSFLPLIVVTADRPWEAYDAASPQTIDQVKLFGGHVRHHAELGLPDPAPAALRAVTRIGAQAVLRALAPEPGPVHVNVRFRKPLEPVDIAGREAWEDEVASLLETGAPRTHRPRVSVTESTLDALARELRESRRPLLVCGPAAPRDEKACEDVFALARQAGAPLLVEATSQLRFGGQSPQRCGAFDAILRSAAFCRDHVPDLVLELGRPPTSSAYAAWLAEHPGMRRWVIEPYAWADPTNSAAELVRAEPAEVAALLASRLADARSAPGWVEDFIQAERAAWDCAAADLAQPCLNEGLVARKLVAALPADAVLVVGNSGPVRDLDTYCEPSRTPLTVPHQRGANGIDGLVSGAAGARSATSRPLALLLGDLSLIHDLGGLLLVRDAAAPFCIVVVHNDGGRIFESLPLARRAEVADTFTRFFVLPHGLDFAAAAALFSLDHRRVTTSSALDAALLAALGAARPMLIEAVVPPQDGARRRTELWRAVEQRLAGGRG